MDTCVHIILLDAENLVILVFRFFIVCFVQQPCKILSCKNIVWIEPYRHSIFMFGICCLIKVLKQTCKVVVRHRIIRIEPEAGVVLASCISEPVAQVICHGKKRM